jgi:hypothetical protein
MINMCVTVSSNVYNAQIKTTNVLTLN